MNITGFVKNRPDGSVYIEAEGKKKDLSEFTAWCQKGTPMAEIVRVEITEDKLKNFKAFTVK